MLSRWLDNSFSSIVKKNVTTLTAARLSTNACYRFTPPFVAIIAKGFNVSLSEIGIALTVSEFSGLLSPFIGRFVDRLSRRVAMLAGLFGISFGALLAAVSPNLIGFTIGVTMISVTKNFFDLGMSGWIADHVAYEKRGRIIGLTEISWALGLLIGVSGMGIITALFSWRAGFAAGAIGVLISTSFIASRIKTEPHEVSSRIADDGVRLSGRAWLVVATMFATMCASQCIFITFGAWLDDEFGFGALGIAAVGFSFGLVELYASLTSASKTDTWGKEISIAIGALIMVPGGLVLAVVSHNLVLGLLALMVYILGFEFAVVSMLPLATHLVPKRPGSGLGLVFGAGTLGRGVMSFIATRAYESSNGIALPALIGAISALVGALLMFSYYRRGGLVHTV
ncbi:MAG: MFS transporter [Actinobacteria bacterium]|nr:MAG: MFS transporter [Actinomycetota bacterium]